MGVTDPSWAKRLFGSLTSDRFCGDGSFFQTPLAPNTQGFLSLHLGGHVLCRHQGLCSWGERTILLRISFQFIGHQGVLWSESWLSALQGTAQASWIPTGDMWTLRSRSSSSREVRIFKKKGYEKGYYGSWLQSHQSRGCGRRITMSWRTV